MAISNLIFAASYERVSTDEQANEGHSLEVQNEKNIQYIRNENWNFYDSFIDPGISGKNLKRPGLQALLEAIRKKHVQVVVVHKLDRLTRNVGDLHFLIKLFEEYDIKLVSVTEKLDTSTAMGRMFVYMLGIFAQWYRENLAEEVIKGMTKRADKGLHNITVDLYGYRRDDDGNLHIVEEQAKWVRYIFERYLSGVGSTNIAKELNKSGIRRNQGGKWDQHKVMMTLTNWHYTGRTHYKVDDKPEDQRIVRMGKHEAIISMDTYERAQRILQRRRDGTISRNSYEYVFGGIVRCGDCGGSYMGKYNKTKLVNGVSTLYRGYVCSNNERYGSCKASGISELNLVKLVFNHVNLQTGVFENYDEQVQGQEVDEREEIEHLLRQSEMKRARWQHAYGEGLMNFDDFAARMREESEKVKAWQEQLSNIAPAHVSTIPANEAVSALDAIKDNWNMLDQETKKQVIQHLFQRIVIQKKDKWEITSIILA